MTNPRCENYISSFSSRTGSLRMRWPVAENRIADGGIGANIAELAEALDAGRMDLVVLLRQQDHFDAGNVGIHRQQIIGEVVVDMAVRGVIDC